MSRFDDTYERFLRGRQESHRMRRLVCVEKLAPGRFERGGRQMLDFCSNDYLGLSYHPALIEQSTLWAQKWGCGSMGSRLICGTLNLHREVEEKIAKLKQSEAALLFNSGFQANATIIPALLDRKILGAKPIVFADRAVHASIHSGLRAAGIRAHFFRHNDLSHLEMLLAKARNRDGPRFIFAESIYSVDGDRADVPQLIALSRQYRSFFLLDEAHATGVVGPAGMGLSTGYSNDIDLVMGTFSKAMGSFGGYISSSKILRDFLINRCNGFIYTTALPPAILGSIDAALTLIPSMEKERCHLQKQSRRLRSELNALGFDTMTSNSQIIPVAMNDEISAIRAAAKLEAENILCLPFRPPTVPPGSSRLRLSVNAAHRAEDIDRVIEGFRSL